MVQPGAANGGDDDNRRMHEAPDGDEPSLRADDAADVYESTRNYVPPSDTTDDNTVGGRKSPGAEAPARPISVPKRFGDYELLSEIARGGMGVVYKAHQLSLDRVVALKVIRSGSFADDEELRRFRIESRAAAQLDHPHIVPVHEVGTCNGQDYFTMGYVEGQSLEGHLTAGPLSPREAAELLFQIATAIHYAHQKGVVHRDLKPSNILLARRDVSTSDTSRGRSSRVGHSRLDPRITDFGLALQLKSAERLTVAGQIVGTPSYMSPEQASGQVGVGPSTDVYSLGALLYRMLTGRPPFRADSLLDILQQVRTQEPVRPWQIDAGIPRDLETICLRCLAKEPGRRYATAGDLADDLARFLRSETILARPSPGWERGWKWVRRRPSVALLTVVVAVSIGIAIGMQQWFRSRLDEGNTRVERQEQSLNRESSRRELAEADALIASMRAAMSELVLLAAQVEGYRSAEFLDPPQRVALQDAVAGHEDLITGFEHPHPSLNRRLLEGASSQTYHELLAGCRFTLGVLQSALGKSSAVESMQAAKDLWEQLLVAEPTQVAYRHGLASCCYNLGDYYLGADELSLAEEMLTAAREHVEQLPPEQQPELMGRILYQTGMLMVTQSKLDDAERQFELAEPILTAQLESVPTDAAVTARLARVQFSLGLVCVMTDRNAQADPHYRRSLDTQQTLVQRVGLYNRSRHDLAAILTNYGQLRWQLGDIPTGQVYLLQAVDEARILMKLAPSDSARAVLSRSFYHLASFLFSQDDSEQAAPLLEESLVALDAIEHDPVPDLPALRQMVRFGLLQVSLNRADHRRAFEMVEQMLPHSPHTGEELFLAASFCAQCAALAGTDGALGDSDRGLLVQQYGDRAVDLLRQAVDAGFEDAERLGGAPEWETLRQRDDYQEMSQRIN